MKDLQHYILLAELFKYPDGNFVKVVNQCQQMMELRYPEAANRMRKFTDYINNCDQDAREELFTKTFDVQPICYLDLGYVIFGEDYKRGAFLLHMQGEQQKYNNDCGTDLPDNICNVFTLMAQHPSAEFVEELAQKIVIPAAKKMIAEFETARVDLKIQVLKKLHKALIQEELNRGNVYRECLEAVLNILETDFGVVEVAVVAPAGTDSEHHRTFFSKESVNKLVNIKTKQL